MNLNREIKVRSAKDGWNEYDSIVVMDSGCENGNLKELIPSMDRRKDFDCSKRMRLGEELSLGLVSPLTTHTCRCRNENKRSKLSPTPNVLASTITNLKPHRTL